MWPWLGRDDSSVDDDKESRWGKISLVDKIEGRKVKGVYLGKLSFSFFAGDIDDWCMVIFDLGDCWLEVRTHDDYAYLFGMIAVSSDVPKGDIDPNELYTSHLVDIIRWA